MSRPAIAILSKANLQHNVQVIKDRSPNSKIIAMVKANAYGHGIRSVSKRLEGMVDLLGVASIDEALAIKEAGGKSTIILMQGIFEPYEIEVAAENGFHIVFNNKTQLQWIKAASLAAPIYAWVKVNTGMGRLGYNLDDAKAAYEILDASPNVCKPVRIISHFACADIPGHPLNAKQIENFNNFITNYQTEYSFCNSAGIISFPECHHHFVRPGLMLYGASPFDHLSAEDLGLKPVMTMKSKLISIQHVKKGQTIGYGARYECQEDMPVGVVAFGYADGYPLSARDGAPILVNGVECPLIGRVSMDMLTVDLRPCSDAKIGDEVVLWGEGLPIERVVKHSANIVWNTFTNVQHRVRFYWVD